MATASSSACGWEIGIGLSLGALFTVAELAAADQLSGSGGGDEASPSSSPRSVNTCAGTAAWEVEQEMSLGLGMELDRRARKRYRLLSELYAATRLVTSSDAASNRKRKRGHKPDVMMRYGDQCY